MVGEVVKFSAFGHHIKFIYSEKATEFCEIFPFLLLYLCTVVKLKGTISQNFVAFSEYVNFKKITFW